MDDEATGLDLMVLATAGKIIRDREANGGTSREITVGALYGALPEEYRRACIPGDLYASVGRLVERGHLKAEVV